MPSTERVPFAALRDCFRAVGRASEPIPPGYASEVAVLRCLLLPGWEPWVRPDASRELGAFEQRCSEELDRKYFTDLGLTEPVGFLEYTKTLHHPLSSADSPLSAHVLRAIAFVSRCRHRIVDERERRAAVVRRVSHALWPLTMRLRRLADAATAIDPLVRALARSALDPQGLTPMWRLFLLLPMRSNGRTPHARAAGWKASPS